VFAGVNDGLHLQGIEILGEAEFLPMAFALFMGLQFFVIARRFSLAFKSVEDLSANLERKVEERTQRISEQKEEIQQQKNAIEESSQKLSHAYQKMTDSVRYASRIQQAILGDHSEIESFFQVKSGWDAFVFFEPRDVVSGDFYWFSEVEGHKIIIAADCTGHGVPGALMTILSYELLDDVILNRKIIEPDKILQEVDKKMAQALQKHRAEKKPHDGMDLAIVVISPARCTLHYAGAKNPLFIVRSDAEQQRQIHQIKGSRFGIGGRIPSEQKSFENHSFSITQGDVFYIASDGFQDQFGGPQHRKYLSKRFREFLLSISELPMREQRDRLSAEMQQWRTTPERIVPQTDDVLVIGMRI
jgi:serine phosphatase RsbU (regulator of sigma subunit)